MNLKELAIKHPYYASELNYYSNEAGARWDTMTDFLDEFEDADVDMNLVYRWDVMPYDGYHSNEKRPGEYFAQVVIIGQRKGLYLPHRITNITEDEVERFVIYLEKHWKRMREIWQPFTDHDEQERPDANA